MMAIVLTLVVSVFCRQILVLMNTPSNILDYAYDYIFIIFVGIPVIIMYNLFSAMLRALGDSKHPVYFVVIASVINIFLDLFCILVLHMGVAGAAVATVISQLVSGICCIVFMIRKIDVIRTEKDEWKYNSHYTGYLIQMGIPMGLQYSITAIGSVILQTAVNGLGSDAVASMTAAGKVSMLFCCPFDSMGATMATYGGQNVGTRKLDRLGTGLKACIELGVIYSIIAFLVLYFFGANLTRLFLSASETKVISDARMFLIYNSVFYIPLALVNIIRFLIQGMGYPGFAIISGICEMVARIFAAVWLIPIIGFAGACLASPIAWIAADCFLIPAFLTTRKRLYKSFNMTA